MRENMGEDKTLEQLFRAHHADMRMFAYRQLNDWALAEEIANDTFVVAYRRSDVQVNRAWLYRTARNLIGDAIRKRDRQRDLISTLETELADGDTAAGQTDLMIAIASLHESDRLILTLTFWDQLPDVEIAQVMRMAAGSVPKRRRRALDRLRRALLHETGIADSWEVTDVAMD